MTGLVIEDSEETLSLGYLQYTFDVGVHRQAAELFHELWTLPIRRQQDADEGSVGKEVDYYSKIFVLWLYLFGGGDFMRCNASHSKCQLFCQL